MQDKWDMLMRMDIDRATLSELDYVMPYGSRVKVGKDNKVSNSFVGKVLKGTVRPKSPEAKRKQNSLIDAVMIYLKNYRLEMLS